ncbi:MAG: Co2+/Mg2+ efflux protein ApaG [Rhodospirillaceae bacterium]
MYEAVTRGVRITVIPVFLEDQSSPENAHYVWAYQVTIQNTGTETVQLLSRHWIITDAAGKVQDVKGAGVVGEQPVLAPGQSFEYTSGAPLATPTGFMGGSYTMRTAGGEAFEAAIPTFSLDSPHLDIQLH